MKKLLYSALLLFALSCSNAPTTTTSTTQAATTQQTSTGFYGEAITAEGALTIAEMKELMGDKKEIAVKVTAPVEAVCQKKGCWMELAGSDGTAIRVTFKDYGFFVPKDASGKTAIVQGKAKVEETSVADLKEYAKDDGKNADEIAAITEPKRELVFEATGVILN